MITNSGHVLLVDDDIVYATLLASKLKREGYSVTKASNGPGALAFLRETTFDVVLLDILMPDMDGYQVLQQMKQDEHIKHVPVIVISGSQGMEEVIRCIESGALDFLPKKPFNHRLLKARLNAAFAAQRLHVQERQYLAQKERSERLLLNILPAAIAEKLTEGQETIAELFDEVTVLFADIVGFTSLAEKMEPTQLVVFLNDIFSVFDELAKRRGLEKIKTIGDSYMVVGGLPSPRDDHAEAVADMALDIVECLAQIQSVHGKELGVRIGVNSGPVVAGVIGTSKFSYDLWGNTVNLASRMESQGVENAIQVTQAVYDRLKDKYVFNTRNTISVKGIGRMRTYLLRARRKRG